MIQFFRTESSIEVFFTFEWVQSSSPLMIKEALNLKVNVKTSDYN